MTNEIDEKKLEKMLEKMLFDKDFQALQEFLKKRKRTVFDIIVKQRDELTFSRVLKYFLDPNEDHNRRDFFLKEFLHILIKKNEEDLNSNREMISRLEIVLLDLNSAKVYREYSIGTYGKLDIFVEKKEPELALLIENKVESGEAEGQTNRYGKWVEKELINNKKYKKENILMCFLTPEGLDAENSNFCPLSFRDILPIFENEETKKSLSHDNQYLIENYVNWIKEFKMGEDIVKKCRRLYGKYKVEIDTITKNAATIRAFLLKMEDYIIKEKFKVNSGHNWLSLSPKEWMEKGEKFKYTKKASKARCQFNYENDTEKLGLYLVTPDEKDFKELVEKKKGYKNVFRSKQWWGYECYYEIDKEESFIPENFIDDWDKEAKERSEKIMERMKEIKGITEIEDIINNYITSLPGP